MLHETIVFLTHLHLKNFRCFDDARFDFQGKLILIEGLNGSGKTSLLEALHYLCYVRSFRTHSPRDLLALGQDSFFIKALFDNHDALSNELQAGFSGKKRSVKINQKSVNSYKDLIDHYRIITVTEDDLGLIQGGPEVRRFFLDQAILLYNPEVSQVVRTLRLVVEQRNALLNSGRCDNDSYRLWTEQLLTITQDVQRVRMEALANFEQATNELLHSYVDPDLTVTFMYKAKRLLEAHDADFIRQGGLMAQEMRYKYSLFGAHLDDFTILFQNKRSKGFSSRGQQKLIVLLIKIAQIKELLRTKGPAIFLLDDFMTDFDHDRAGKMLGLLNDLNIQLILTSPTDFSFFPTSLFRATPFRVKLA